MAVRSSEELTGQYRCDGLLVLTGELQFQHITPSADKVISSLLHGKRWSRCAEDLPQPTLSLCRNLAEELHAAGHGLPALITKSVTMYPEQDQPVLVNGLGLRSLASASDSRLVLQFHAVRWSHDPCDFMTISARILTNREASIMRELFSGCTNKEIGVRLGISEYTVKDHLKRLMQKLKVSTRTGLVLAAWRQSAESSMKVAGGEAVFQIERPSTASAEPFERYEARVARRSS